VTLSFKYDLYSVKVNQHTKYLGQILFCSQVIVWIQQKHTNSHDNAIALHGPLKYKHACTKVFSLHW